MPSVWARFPARTRNPARPNSAHHRARRGRADRRRAIGRCPGRGGSCPAWSGCSARRARVPDCSVATPGTAHNGRASVAHPRCRRSRLPKPSPARRSRSGCWPMWRSSDHARGGSARGKVSTSPTRGRGGRRGSHNHRAPPQVVWTLWSRAPHRHATFGAGRRARRHDAQAVERGAEVVCPLALDAARRDRPARCEGTGRAGRIEGRDRRPQEARAIAHRNARRAGRDEEHRGHARPGGRRVVGARSRRSQMVQAGGQGVGRRVRVAVPQVADDARHTVREAQGRLAVKHERVRPADAPVWPAHGECVPHLQRSTHAGERCGQLKEKPPTRDEAILRESLPYRGIRYAF